MPAQPQGARRALWQGLQDDTEGDQRARPRRARRLCALGRDERRGPPVCGGGHRRVHRLCRRQGPKRRGHVRGRAGGARHPADGGDARRGDGARGVRQGAEDAQGGGAAQGGQGRGGLRGRRGLAARARADRAGRVHCPAHQPDAARRGAAAHACGAARDQRDRRARADARRERRDRDGVGERHADARARLRLVPRGQTQGAVRRRADA
mmetsp:Transcript_11764/g.30960  ORF Transcript_11764/g.30960 Transcript_11764/m.30960 type:complete len:209 (+) Transcript_11764:2436-3062(+)